jgi:hypothetical protein
VSDLHRIDHERGLYVLKHPAGFTCLGFDVCAERSRKLMKWIQEHGQPVLSIALEMIRRKGTRKAYDAYCKLLSEAQFVCAHLNIRCDIELTRELIGLEGRRVEVIDRHGEKRRFEVGKSVGWMPCHLEIARRNSSGGPAVMGTPYRSVRVIR